MATTKNKLEIGYQRRQKGTKVLADMVKAEFPNTTCWWQPPMAGDTWEKNKTSPLWAEDNSPSGRLAGRAGLTYTGYVRTDAMLGEPLRYSCDISWAKGQQAQNVQVKVPRGRDEYPNMDEVLDYVRQRFFIVLYGPNFDTPKRVLAFSGRYVKAEHIKIPMNSKDKRMAHILTKALPIEVTGGGSRVLGGPQGFHKQSGIGYLIDQITNHLVGNGEKKPA